MRSWVVRWAQLLIVGAIVLAGVFWGTEQLASAQSVPLGAQIVCLVYHDLNTFGSPIPILTAPGCAATSTPPGGGNLEILKLVDGGSSVSSDFEIHVMSGGTDISGSPEPGSSTGVTFIGLAPGSYVVSESGSTTAEYSGAFSGECNAGGSVSVAAGTTAVCTLTNTFTGSGSGTSTGATIGGSVSGTVDPSSGLSGTVGTSSGNSLSGTVSSGNSLSGTVGSGNGLSGTVTATSSSGGGSGGGGGGGGGSNGPLAVGGGGGGPITPAGQVLGASTSTNPTTTTLPGIPNTGAGGNAAGNLFTLALAGALTLCSSLLLRVRPVAKRQKVEH